MSCSYPDREAALVSYLYDDDNAFGAAERVAFESHISACLICRSDLADFHGVRSTLAQWAPPVPERAFSLANREPRTPSLEARSWWHQVPVWAQVAAAMLVLGVSASVANLNIRYDKGQGLNITTGWSKPAPVIAQPADAAPWRAELTALQNQLRSEIRTQAAAVRTAPASSSTDADVVRRVRALLDESEKNQQKELALRLAQMQIDVNAQLDADRRRQSENLRSVTNTYGNQILKQQQQINYLLPASLK